MEQQSFLKKIVSRGVLGIRSNIRSEIASRRMMYREAEARIDEFIGWEYD